MLDLILGDVVWTWFQDIAWVSLSAGLLLSVWAPALVHGSLGRVRSHAGKTYCRKYLTDSHPTGTVRRTNEKNPTRIEERGMRCRSGNAFSRTGP